MKTVSTLVELLDLRFETDRDRTAYIFIPGDEDRQEQVMSYAELERRCNAVACLVREYSEVGDRILLLYPPGLGFIEAFLGCIRAGRVAVPVGTVRPNRPGNHLQSIMTNCEPAAVLANREYYQSLAKKDWINKSLGDVPVIFSEDADSDAASEPAYGASKDTLAFLQYTSGSTREPRGVMVTHGNLLADMSLIRQSFGFDPDTRMFGWLPFFHDMGLVGNLMQPLEQGNTSILMPAMHFLSQPVRWLRGISRYKATISGGPNFAYDLCVDRIKEEERRGLDLSSWKVAFNGSEPINAKTLRRFTEAFAPYGFRAEAMYPCYGMAECTLFVSGKPHGTPDHFVATSRKALAEGQPQDVPGAEVELVACGTTWPGQTICIVDPEQLREMHPRRVGEIWVSGAHVSSGYWNNESVSAESFGFRLEGREESFLRTGDLGFMDEDGRLYITGRRKEVIIVRGKNHYPQDLEETAQGHVEGLLAHRGAVFISGDFGREEITLVQEVTRGLAKSSYPSVAERIREEVLAEHGILLHEIVLVRVGGVPLTSSGKIQRLKCRRMLASGELSVLYRARADGGSGQLATSTANAEPKATPSIDAVVKMLEQLVRKHGPRKDATVVASGTLAQYGVDSVASVALIRDLSDWLGREVETTALWEFPNVGALAGHLAGDASAQSDTQPELHGELHGGVTVANPRSVEEGHRVSCVPAKSEPTPAGGVLDGLQFSLLFFASEDLQDNKDGYRLLMEAARFADQTGFHAIWTPERHFHAFGGLYPAPSVLSAALARETKRVRLRSGSVVLPLHNPVRVAEEWALVDNLSDGRVDLGVAQGWNANDFVLAAEAYPERKQRLFHGVETIRKLWRGEEVALRNGRGDDVSVRIYPSPQQKELAVWVTCSGGEERFIEAGEAGFNILTALLFQPKEELFRKIALYRQARAKAGHEGPGLVTLMLHTFVHPDAAHVKATTKAPFLRYLETSTNLWQQEWDALQGLSEGEREKALDFAYERYVRTTSLIGTPEFARQTCAQLRQNGVDEIACLVDFGLSLEATLHGVAELARLAGNKTASWSPSSDHITVGRTQADEPIAVIGVAARVPGGDTAVAFWDNLRRGVDSVGVPQAIRWPSSADTPGTDGQAAEEIRAGWLSGVDLFDAEFFRVSPHEAAMMDPQQRLFLETAWTCVQDAGYSGPDLQGQSVGVYVGASDARYDAHFRWNDVEPDPYMLAGSTVCTLPARLSYYLNLRGPCVALDTACSSSLVAVHEACRALRAGECESAIAGGVSLLLTPDLFHVAGKAGMLSPSGKCRPFDADANGYVPGEGAGAVFLKPLSAALRDGDGIYGVIRGSAINHDGQTNGITAPNPIAQVEVARAALRQAAVSVDSVGYVECHGTGTHLGDPIEFGALQTVYGARQEIVPIGSVKSNIGHLLAAAGVASFLKTLFSLKHRLLVPSLHFQQPNPNLKYDSSPLRVVTEVSPWESTVPRRAVVSGYGHSGTNCTVVLEEYTQDTVAGGAVALPCVILPCVVSGRTEAELREYIALLSDHLLKDRNVKLEAIARTLAQGRVSYPCRAVYVARSVGELAGLLRASLKASTITGPEMRDAALGRLAERTDDRAQLVRQAVAQFLDGEAPDWNLVIPAAHRAHLPAYPLH